MHLKELPKELVFHIRSYLMPHEAMLAKFAVDERFEDDFVYFAGTESHAISTIVFHNVRGEGAETLSGGVFRFARNVLEVSFPVFGLEMTGVPPCREVLLNFKFKILQLFMEVHFESITGSFQKKCMLMIRSATTAIS